uniref:Uncharacterized protein n=1 Tax=Arundo donax TaxID=35708 RepID=A0A0A9CFU9_ARUDO
MNTSQLSSFYFLKFHRD